MEQIINYYTHDRCDHLARCLHNKTDFPIYAIYDPTDHVCVWGIEYWHFFVKIGDDKYLNARGVSTSQEMKEFWAAAWKDESIIENAKIVKKSPEIGNVVSNHYTDMSVLGNFEESITEATKAYADELIDIFLS